MLLRCQAFAQASASPACTWNPGNGSWTTAANWTTCHGTFSGTGASAGADANVVDGIATLSTGNVSAGTLTGNVYLNGDALLEFGSGGLTSVALRLVRRVDRTHEHPAR